MRLIADASSGVATRTTNGSTRATAPDWARRWQPVSNRCEMTWLPMFLLLSLAQTSQDNAPSFWTYGGSYEGKTVEFRVTRSDVEATPRWLSSAQYPPLSPRVAIESARTMMRTLFSDGDAWRFGDIRLVPTVGESWIYVVGFGSPAPPPPGPVMPERPLKPGEIISVVGSQSSTLMDVPVFMDGRTVEPVVTPFKPNQR